MRSESPLHVVQLTDIHLCQPPGDLKGSGVNTDESLVRVLAAIAAQASPIDLILATGDLAQDPCAEVYQRLRQRLQQFDLPVLCLPGNHDEPALMVQHLVGGHLHMPPAWQAGPWQVVLLDSRVPNQIGGALAPAAYQQLAQQLAEGAEHVLICLHHHPVPTGNAVMDQWMLAEPATFFNTLADYPQVRGVLWGHIHREFHRRADGRELIGSPSTCIQFSPLGGVGDVDVATLPPAYRRLQLWPDGRITTEVVYVPAVSADPG